MRKHVSAAIVLFVLIESAAGTTNAAGVIKTVICTLVPQVMSLARALAILMFIYGGAKYAYSADDPGGRKQARSIAVNAMIGAIIVSAAKAVVEAIAGGAVCT